MQFITVYQVNFQVVKNFDLNFLNYLEARLQELFADENVEDAVQLEILRDELYERHNLTKKWALFFGKAWNVYYKGYVKVDVEGKDLPLVILMN